MSGIPYTALEQGQIRLLRLVPGNLKVRTIFSLETYDINHAPSYFALSYTWGDPDEIGGTIWYQPGAIEVLVTPNLFYGLHRLQEDIHRNHGAHVWVDALCIDQMNLAEKAQQIPLMGRIFAGAEQVVAWLGLGTPEEEVAIKTIKALWSQMDAVAKQYSSVGGWFERVESVARLLPSAQDPFWPQFLELIAKPWHNRVWTVQEACVDTSVTFLVGVHEHISLLDFMGFVAMVRAARSNGVGFLYSVTSRTPSPDAKGELISRLVSRYQECEDRQDELLDERRFLPTVDRYLSDLLEDVYNVDLLLRYRLGPDTAILRHLIFRIFYGRNCTVLSDRVAAMTGILTPSLALDPSLNLTTNEAFMVASHTWWLRDPELTFLHFIEPNRKSRTHPSWALDFELLQHSPLAHHGLDQESGYSAGMLANIVDGRIRNAAPGKSCRVDADVLLQWRARTMTFGNCDSLNVTAIFADRLKKVQARPSFPLGELQALQRRQEEVPATDSSELMQRMSEWMGDCRAFAKQALGEKDYLEPYWRSMTANARSLEHNPSHHSVDKFYQDDRAASHDAVVRALATSDAAALADLTGDVRAYYEDIASASAIRKMVATIYGRIGLVPNGEVGDEVVVFHGAHKAITGSWVRRPYMV